MIERAMLSLIFCDMTNCDITKIDNANRNIKRGKSGASHKVEFSWSRLEGMQGRFLMNFNENKNWDNVPSTE